MDYLLLVLGLIILIVGGEVLVKGAVGIALKFKISALVVGMTIVSLGTSAPELLVSVKAALDGHPDIAIGNVIGSNVANLALVLGLTAMVFPISVDKNSIRIDWPFMMLATIGFVLAILNGFLEFWEALLFVIALILFNAWIILKSRKEGKKAAKERAQEVEEVVPANNIWKNILFIAVGCFGLAFGADWLVEGAVGVAQSFDVSERVISITIIAFGTSVPELITSGVAAVRKQTDISIGNLIGSNIFNILAILGITGMIKEIPINPEVLRMDVYWVVGIVMLLFPLMIFQREITRWKGALLFLFYCAYIYFLF